MSRPMMLLLLAAAVPATAQEGAEAVRNAVTKLDPNVRVESPSKSPVTNLYRTSLDGTPGYLTADGRYFIVGDMYETATRRNLTEEARQGDRLAALAEVTPREMIVFAAEKPRFEVTVFTDVDCGYCRKLHGEMSAYNAAGITIRYLAFPRNGRDSESWNTMESVWCAKDRRDAITRAKRGEKVAKTDSCGEAPVDKHFALGERLGVQGTPMMLLPDGRALPGYVPPAQLVAMLDPSPVSGSAASAAR